VAEIIIFGIYHKHIEDEENIFRILSLKLAAGAS